MVAQRQLNSLREFETKEYWDTISRIIEKHKPKPKFTTNEQVVLDFLAENGATLTQIAKMMKEKQIWKQGIETHTAKVLNDLIKKGVIQKDNNIYKLKN